MFENIIAQRAADQLRDDIQNERDVQSMLFYGPEDSGKGSAALELARVYSCEEAEPQKRAAWTCVCSSCERHRFLAHDDLLLLGSRSFSSDILACKSVFLRNTQPGTKILFYRALRKLQLRFSPVILENDAKTAKSVSSVLLALDEGLNELLNLDTSNYGQKKIEKITDSLVKDAFKLEEEGISDSVPVSHIRSASFWCRLAPSGKRKILIIENAECVSNDGFNSLLKILEEPPANVSIVLTAQRREAIIPTILSRVRPYRFLKRDAKEEKDVIRRVFQDQSDKGLSSYLGSFLENNNEKIYPLAAWFIVSLVRITLISAGKNAAQRAVFLTMLAERYAQIAKEASQERCVKSSCVIKEILGKTGNFKEVSFSAFMKAILDQINDAMRSFVCENRFADDQNILAYNDLIKKYINEAVSAVDVYNISAAISLEALFLKMKTCLRGFYG